MEAGEYFAESYRSARGKFLAACETLQLRPTAFRAPGSPGEPEPPLLDFVRLGDQAATRVLIVCGGDRRMDALCCSGIEVGWLNEFAKANLPRDTAIALLHHGAAPQSGGETTAAGEPPPEWEDDVLANVEKRYAEYARLQGVDAMGAPLRASSEAGVPGYPAKMLDSVAGGLGSAATGRIALIDIRVGLGRYGEAEITPCHPPDSAAARRVRSWFAMSEPQDTDGGVGAQTPDSLAAGLMRRFPGAEITAFSAAFGTYSMMSVLDSLASRPEGESTPDPRRLLFPKDDAWRDAVWHSAIIVIQRALTALHIR